MGKGNHRASEMQTQTAAPTPLRVREGWGKINLNNSLWTAALTFGFFCWFIALSICLSRAGIVSARSTAGAWSGSRTPSPTAQTQRRVSAATLIRLHLRSSRPRRGSTRLGSTDRQGGGRAPRCLLPRATAAAGPPRSSGRRGSDCGRLDSSQRRNSLAAPVPRSWAAPRPNASSLRTPAHARLPQSQHPLYTGPFWGLFPGTHARTLAQIIACVSL